MQTRIRDFLEQCTFVKFLLNELEAESIFFKKKPIFGKKAANTHEFCQQTESSTYPIDDTRLHRARLTKAAVSTGFYTPLWHVGIHRKGQNNVQYEVG